MRTTLWIGLALGLGLVAWLALRAPRPDLASESALERAVQGPAQAAPTGRALEPARAQAPAPSTTTPPSGPSRRVAQVDPRSRAFRGYPIRGRVLDADGAPARDVEVRVWEWEDPAFHVEDYEPFAETERSPDGGFEVRADRQGEFRVWARSVTGGSSEVVPVRLNPRTPEAEVELRLSRTTRIAGRVVDGDGAPIGQVMVVAFVDVERYAQPLPEGLTSREYWGVRASRSNREGRFVLNGIDARAAGYELWCSGRGPRYRLVSRLDAPAAEPPRVVRRAQFAEATRVAPGSESVELVLGDWRDTGAAAALDVRMDGGGEPPDALSCRVRRVGPRGSSYHEWLRGVRRNEDGEYLVEDLLPGARYVVELTGLGQGEETESESFVAVPGVVSVPLLLDATFPVELRVRGSDGQPPQRADVTFSAQGTFHLQRVWGRSNVDRWPVRLALPKGVYELDVVSDRRESIRRPVVVEDRPVELSVDLAPE